ncbi:MAG TPA: rhombosortase [Planctomycetota bacterium]|nr:rhombosortase [Planctomycetota bacterium]
MMTLPGIAMRSGRWPLVTFALAAIAGLVAVAPELQPHLVGARAAVAAGEAWRLVTAHFVHASSSHFAWDLAAFAVLGVLCERAGRTRFVACLCTSALLIPAGLWLWQPSLSSYCGLSGMDSALFALLVADVLRRAAAARQPGLVVAASLVAAGFVAKIGYEFTTASTVFVEAAGVPVPLAHVIGAVVGLLCGRAASAPGQRQRAGQ